MSAKKTRKSGARSGGPTKGSGKLADGHKVLVGAFALLVVAVAWSGLGVVDDARETRALYQELGSVQQKHDRLLENNSRLILERSTLSSHQAVEEVATAEMNMHFPAAIHRVQP